MTEGEASAVAALDLVPTNETAVQQFLTALASAGDRATAIRFYEKFTDCLREAIDLEPSPETKGIIDAIRGGAYDPTPDPPGERSARSGEAGSLRGPPPPPPGTPDTLPSQVQREARERRHIVEWGAAYIAAGWALLELVSYLDARLRWPTGVRPTLNVLVVFGCLTAMVLAWYHRRTGSRRVSGPELLIIALLLLVAGIGLSLIPR